jgi:Zn-dependent M28 family amino/carboxypeptidase
LTGKIALIFRGTCQSGIKDGFAGSAGASGVLIYNNVEGNLDGYSLQLLSVPNGPYVPTGGISQADGLALIARIQGGEKVVASLSTEMSVKTTYNIIAETKQGDHDNVIHISGHSDSVAAGMLRFFPVNPFFHMHKIH